MAQNGILSYYYFEGESIYGDFIEGSTSTAMTDDDMIEYATAILKEYHGGHLDVFYSETDELTFFIEL